MNLNGQLHELVGELVRRGVTLDEARKVFEKEFIVSTLRQNDGNLSRAARTLGVHRNTLRNKVSALDIANDEYVPAARRRGAPKSLNKDDLSHH